MNDRAIGIAGLEVALSGRRVLGPVELAVSRGEYVVVVGSSGSGKTTLLRAIAGLVRPRAGRVTLGGVLASDGARLLVPPERRRIGFVFQGGGLWPHLSAARTIEFVLRCRGVPRAVRARRTAELLEAVELPGFGDRLPATLSGGEAQRLALARALAVEPEILLLDEPLGPLDVALRGSLVRMLSALCARLTVTTLHVTHDPGEVASLATRTVRLEHGVLSARETDDPPKRRELTDGGRATERGVPLG